MDFEFDETQLKAIGKCCDVTHRIVGVTGKAGTGKTTILQEVYNTLDTRKYDVVLCAPTGKAAKRITEATGIEARTIHRLLEYPHPGQLDPDTGKALITTDPKRDRQHPLKETVILADEYNMVNDEVHRNLLAAIPNGGVLRVFGDANQLQPIETNKRLQREPSQFLKLLDKFEGFWLDTIHRQAEGSSIITNGARIMAGQVPIRAEDFVLNITNEPVRQIENFVMEGMENGHDFTSINNQIISPTKIGWIGTEALNQVIQGLLQPDGKIYFEATRHKWCDNPTQRFYIGDKVIFTVNNYGLEIFNGETGIILEYDIAAQIVVDFGDKIVTIPPQQKMENKHGTYYIDPQKDLDLAYVITTHKSQGSEYDRVCYVMNRSRSYLLNRKNFYTGTSRARSHVTVISDQKALSLSLQKKGDK